MQLIAILSRIGVYIGLSMPKAIFQAIYTLLAFSPFSDKDNYFLREIPDFGNFSDVRPTIICIHPCFEHGRHGALLRCSKQNVQRLAVAPSQRRFALARTIVCCGASTVAHFACKVRATKT